MVVGSGWFRPWLNASWRSLAESAATAGGLQGRQQLRRFVEQWRQPAAV